jgi:hypothetical protein
MMENHSYDNYLGMLQDQGEGFPLDSDGKPDVFMTSAQHAVEEAAPLEVPSSTPQNAV